MFIIASDWIYRLSLNILIRKCLNNVMVDIYLDYVHGIFIIYEKSLQHDFAPFVLLWAERYGDI